MSLSRNRYAVMCHLGPAFLLFSLAAVLLKYAQPLLSQLLIAFCGFVLVQTLKKTGFILSLFVMAALAVWQRPLLWEAILMLAIGTSWLLQWLGCREIEILLANASEKEQMIEIENRQLHAQLLEMQTKATKFYQALNEQTTQLEVLRQNLINEVNEKQALLNQIPLPSAVQNNVIVQEETESHSYLLMREQFEEKSELLHLARKELFHLENQFLAQQKEIEEKSYEFSTDVLAYEQQIQKLQEEVADLEFQVKCHADLISDLLTPKKVVRKKKTTSKAQDELPLLLQEKIDVTYPVS